MTPHPALTSYIRSHSGGLALPVAIISLGTPEEDGNHFTSNASQWKTTRVGPLQSFLGAGNDCGISKSSSPLPPLQSFPRKQCSRYACVTTLSLSCLLACLLGIWGRGPLARRLTPSVRDGTYSRPLSEWTHVVPLDVLFTPDPNRHPS